MLSAWGVTTVQTGEENRGTGAKLSTDIYADTDVVGFRFVVTRLGDDAGACPTSPPNTIPSGADVNVYDVNLADNVFPGQMTFLASVFDETSRHLGSDLFLTLDEGCYLVEATPLKSIPQSSSDPVTSHASSDCPYPVSSTAAVLDGGTTDVTLIAPCIGDPLGSLDSLVLLNNPPEVIITFTEDKFNYECEEVEVCAYGWDDNDDPLDFDWQSIGWTGNGEIDNNAINGVGSGSVGVVSVTNTDLGWLSAADLAATYNLQSLSTESFGDDLHRVYQSCATIVTQTTSMADTDYQFSVTVFDQLGDNSSTRS